MQLETSLLILGRMEMMLPGTLNPESRAKKHGNLLRLECLQLPSTNTYVYRLVNFVAVHNIGTHLKIHCFFSKLDAGKQPDKRGHEKLFRCAERENSGKIYIGVYIEIVQRFANRKQHFAIVTIHKLFLFSPSTAFPLIPSYAILALCEYIRMANVYLQDKF